MHLYSHLFYVCFHVHRYVLHHAGKSLSTLEITTMINTSLSSCQILCCWKVWCWHCSGVLYVGFEDSWRGDLTFVAKITPVCYKQEDISVECEGQTHLFKGTLTLVSGDNLTSHYLGGFKSPSGALRRCTLYDYCSWHAGQGKYM